MAQGKVIWDPTSGFAVSIEAGCNGVEAGIILISAMLAYPASWSARLIGILLGNLTVQTLPIRLPDPASGSADCALGWAIPDPARRADHQRRRQPEVTLERAPSRLKCTTSVIS